MNLLFLNALKGLKKKKLQMLGIIFLIILSTSIYTSMNTALDRLEYRYYDYLEEQNVEHISFTPIVDYTKDVTIEDIDHWEKKELKNITEEEKMVLTQYKNCLKDDSCDLKETVPITDVFQKYEIDLQIKNRKLDTITKKYDFTYQIEQSKTTKENNVLIKAMPYLQDKKINQTYLLKGKFPEQENEITMLPQFAKINKIEIGDTYKINNKKYKVVGFTYAPDHIYPMISFNMPIFSEKQNNIIFMNQKTYDQFIGTNENVYVLKYNHHVDRKLQMNQEDSEMNKMFEQESSILIMNMDTATRMIRSSALQMGLKTDRDFALYFLYLLLAIAVFIIIVITKKRIDDERLQIGVLKSLGYNRFSIAISYLVYPIIGSLIGGIIGYMIGISLNGLLTNLYMSYFTIPLGNLKFDASYLTTSIFLPMIVLSILSYFIATIMLRKKPLSLLKEGSNLKVNLLSKIVNKLTSLLPFKYRFKYSLASRSIGKLFIVTLTSFCTGLLIVLVLIGSNLFNHLIDQSFDSYSYQYMIAMNQIQIEDKKTEMDDLIFSSNATIQTIIKKGKEKKVEEEIMVNGIDVDAHFVTLKDKNEKKLNDKLEDSNSMIINRNMQEQLSLNLDDEITIKLGEKEITYKVAGITEEYINYNVYVDRASLSEKMGLPDAAYTMIYSTNKMYENMNNFTEEEQKKIATILNLSDIKKNVETQLEVFNSSIYVVIIFASIMALVILTVIANIVVEENKKTISLMKVMGYKNGEISSIVLNIYTPFVIIAYLLAIPAMTSLLKWIIGLLTADMEMVIPVTLSPLLALIGLIGLLIAYYVAIFFSKRVLNKVPLAIALKRE